MPKPTIERHVVKAIQEMVTEDTSATFSYSLVPSKRLSDGGLGVSWNGWHAMLGSLKNRMPAAQPYRSLVIDVLLVETTFTKELRSLRYWLVKQLLLIEKHGG